MSQSTETKAGSGRCDAAVPKEECPKCTASATGAREAARELFAIGAIHLKWALDHDAGEVAAVIQRHMDGLAQSEETRWQKRIYELCKTVAKEVGVDDSAIDGGGCDSGDALDFTVTEITQAFELLRRIGGEQ